MPLRAIGHDYIIIRQFWMDLFHSKIERQLTHGGLNIAVEEAMIISTKPNIEPYL